MYKFIPILLFAYGLAVTTEDIYDNSYALIIGIDKYQSVQNLNYAVKDAESIQDILVNTFDFPENNVILLKNEDATKQNILQAFSDITTKAEESDRVLIYFAGHGDTDDLPEGGEMGYLLPVDGDNNNLFVTSIAMDDLKRISLMSKAKHLLYLVDACYGGLLTIGSRGLDSNTTPKYIEKITKNKSRQIITAGGRGEEVIEKAECSRRFEKVREGSRRFTKVHGGLFWGRGPEGIATAIQHRICAPNGRCSVGRPYAIHQSFQEGQTIGFGIPH